MGRYRLPGLRCHCYKLLSAGVGPRAARGPWLFSQEREIPPWGERSVTVTDPFHNRLVFFTPDEEGR